jgi:hypothetical protein
MVSNPPPSPFVKGGKISHPFGLFNLPEADKGGWGGILKILFQTAKLI